MKVTTPVGAHIVVKEEAEVAAGSTIAKIQSCW